MPEIQTKPIKGSKAERFFRIDKREIDIEARTVELAFSSETPVERWWGYEILDHGRNAMRKDRISRAAPLLLNHESEDQIGVIESVRVDSDRVGRAVVRFSKNPDAEEIWQDVIDGIRQNVSVGYMIHEAILETQKEGVDTYRITDWEPMEISIVSIPADTTVGVGRNLNTQTREETPMADDPNMPDNEDQADEGEEIRSEQRSQEAVNPEQKPDAKRTAANARIREIGARFDMSREAEDHIALDASVADFQAVVRAKQANRLKPVPSSPRVEVNIPRRTGRLRAFENNARGEEAAYRSGMWAMAMLFGDQEAARWCKDYGVRVMTGTTPGTTSVVPDEMVLPIIDLREQFGVARRYCYVHPMSSDTATIPRRKSGVDAYFVGRTDATTESDGDFDDVQLVAREVAALTRISKSYANDAAINLADHLAMEMAYAFAVKEDDCLFNGDGTSTYGGIQGIRSKILSKAGAIAAASGHDTFAEIDHDDLVNVIGALPEYPGINPRWYSSKRANALVFQALKTAAGGNTARDLEGRPMNEYLGDEIIISQSMPQVVTALNAVAMLVYGDLNMGVTFGDRQGFEIEVLRERYAEYRQIGIQAVERFDINVHGVGDASNAGPITALIGTT